MANLISVIQNALFNEEARRKDIGNDQSHAVITKNRGRQQEYIRGKEKGRSKSIGTSVDGRKPIYKCYCCDLKGGLKKNCKKRSQEQRQNNNKSKRNDGEILVTITKRCCNYLYPRRGMRFLHQSKMLSG